MTILTIDQIASVYSGKPGCCCGCNGNHRYASGHREWASKNRGYEVEDSDINDRQVKKVFNLLLANADQVDTSNADHLFIDLDGRWYIAYLVH
jgi:hypothetical protein